MEIDHFIGSTPPKLCVATVSANRSITTDQEIAQCMGKKMLTQQEDCVLTPPPPPPPPRVHWPCEVSGSLEVRLANQISPVHDLVGQS